MKTNLSLNLFTSPKNTKKNNIFWVIEESEGKEGVLVRFVTPQNEEVHRQRFQDIPKGFIDDSISRKLNNLARKVRLQVA